MMTYLSCLWLPLLCILANCASLSVSATTSSTQYVHPQALPTAGSSFGIGMERGHTDQRATPSQALPLLQLLLAKLERLDVKLDSLEGRLSFVETRLEKDLESLEQRVTDVVRSSSVLVLTTVKDSAKDGTEGVRAAISASEERVASLIESVKESLRDDRSSTESELRDVQTQMSAAEQRQSDHLTSVVNQIDDKIKLHAKLSQGGQPGSNNTSNFGAQLANIIASSEARFENLTNYLESMVDSQIAELVTRIIENTESHIRNKTSSFDTQIAAMTADTSAIFENVTELFESAINKKVSDLDLRISDNSALLASLVKPQACERGLSPLDLELTTPYPVIHPDAGSTITVPHLCDFKTNGGAWVVIQRRTRGDVDFYRNWQAYKTGFGSLEGDFWLGLDAIHNLTSSANQELRIDLKFNGKSAYALYSKFVVESEAEKYRLTVGGYSGTAGDSLDWQNGQTFVTADMNNRPDQNCAEKFSAAWWYRDSSWCYASNLNGQWRSDKGEWFATSWNAFSDGQPLSYIEMKVRPLRD